MFRSTALTVLAALLAFTGLALSDDSAHAGAPGLKHDIVYARKGQIWVMSADGSHQRMLVASGTNPVLSPNRQKIAFVAQPVEEDFEIMVVNVDGSGLTNVSSHPTGDDNHPSWAPNSQRLVYARSGEIYASDIDGSGLVNLTNDPSSDSQPSWLRDGPDQVLFMSNRDGNNEIYVMDADGSNQTNLSNDPANDQSPDWRPGGGKIVFQSIRNGNLDIYVMDPDGSDQTQLTDDPGSDLFPSWQPSFSFILFTSHRTGAPEVWRMDSDGSGEERLTFDNSNASQATWGVLVSGDANCSGFPVDAIDAALVLQLGAGLLSGVRCALDADVNQDGVINALDAALILQHTAGLLPVLPP